MMLSVRPYIKSPYEEMQRINAPWLEEMTNIVRQRIDDMSRWIHDESDACGVSAFEDDDFIYDRFCDNNACGLKYANAEVFRFFLMHFRKKMYHELIGRWTFTNQDVEMYNYFTTEFTCPTRNLRISVFNFLSGFAAVKCVCKTKFYPFENEFDAANNFLSRYTCPNGRSYAVGYFNMFQHQCDMFNAMFEHVRTGKMCEGNYFSDGNFIIGVSKTYCNFDIVNVEEAFPIGTDIGEVQAKLVSQRGSVFYKNNKEHINAKNKEWREKHLEQDKNAKAEYYKKNSVEIRQRVKTYAAENKDKIKAGQRDHYERNKERICEYQKEYRQNNADKIAVRVKAYRERNKEYLYEKGKKYRAKNKDTIAEKKKAYAEANKEKISEYQKQYRIEQKAEISAKQKVYRVQNKEHISQVQKTWRENKKSNGYVRRTYPDGKSVWVYVGNQDFTHSTQQGIDTQA